MTLYPRFFLRILINLIVASSLFASLSAAVFHAVVVGDLDSKDIAHSINFDLQNIVEELKEIGSKTGLPVQSTLFAGSSASTEGILNHLKKLTLKSDDVMFFYFSGHGYRTADKGNNFWPNLYFEREKAGIDLETIINILIEKPSRLTLVIADCCDNVIREQFAPALVGKKAVVINHHFKTDGYQKLFMYSEGFIIASGCKPEQTSLALLNGSLFTLSFLSSLHDMVTMPWDQINWQQVFENSSHLTSSRAKRYRDQQDPVFIIVGDK